MDILNKLAEVCAEAQLLASEIAVLKELRADAYHTEVGTAFTFDMPEDTPIDKTSSAWLKSCSGKPKATVRTTVIESIRVFDTLINMKGQRLDKLLIAMREAGIKV